jgi:cell division protein ZipA
MNLSLDLDGGPSFSSRDNDFPDDRKSASSPEKDQPQAEEVLVISVICRDPAGFKGPALLQNILESGLRFGEMDIFHRHESMAGNGEVLFSMANAVKPGVFDLDDIDHFSTPAVSFFLGLPGPRHPKQAFDVMVAAARKLSQELNGELKDDQRSVLTAQTIEHYRQRIVEFERRALTQKR